VNHGVQLRPTRRRLLTTIASLGSRVASAENTADGESVGRAPAVRLVRNAPVPVYSGGNERATPATSGLIEAMTARSAVLWWASRGSW